MTRTLRRISLATVVAALAFAALGARSQPPPAQPPATQPPPTQPPPMQQPQQPTEVSTTITSGEDGTAPRYAVPDFIAQSRDAETVAIATTMINCLTLPSMTGRYRQSCAATRSVNRA